MWAKRRARSPGWLGTLPGDLGRAAKKANRDLGKKVRAKEARLWVVERRSSAFAERRRQKVFDFRFSFAFRVPRAPFLTFSFLHHSTHPSDSAKVECTAKFKERLLAASCRPLSCLPLDSTRRATLYPDRLCQLMKCDCTERLLSAIGKKDVRCKTHSANSRRRWLVFAHQLQLPTSHEM